MVLFSHKEDTILMGFKNTSFCFTINLTSLHIYLGYGFFTKTTVLFDINIETKDHLFYECQHFKYQKFLGIFTVHVYAELGKHQILL